jgi:hypothetical protein
MAEDGKEQSEYFSLVTSTTGSNNDSKHCKQNSTKILEMVFDTQISKTGRSSSKAIPFRKTSTQNNFEQFHARCSRDADLSACGKD